MEVQTTQQDPDLESPGGSTGVTESLARPPAVSDTPNPPAPTLLGHPALHMAWPFPSEGDRWMHRWVVTGLRPLQRVASLAFVPGAPSPKPETAGRTATCKRPCGHALRLHARMYAQGPRAHKTLHSTWDRYTHISLTLSQVTQSRSERTKTELVSPQRRRTSRDPPGRS